MCAQIIPCVKQGCIFPNSVNIEEEMTVAFYFAVEQIDTYVSLGR